MPDNAGPVRALGGLAVAVLGAGVVAALVAAPHAGAAAGPAAPPIAAVPAVDDPGAGVELVVAAPPAPAPPETTTSIAPPPPAPPAPAPQPAAPVVAAPAPAPPPATDLQARIEQAFAEAVPASWREGLPATLRVIAGNTSYATGPGLIEVGDGPASGSWPHLLSVVAHEYGHLIAFRYGSGAFTGAAPDGWPDPGHGDPAESWADCVAQAFTGVVDPSYDLPPCPRPSLDWTIRWLAGDG